jgi:hypothetical protein
LALVPKTASRLVLAASVLALATGCAKKESPEEVFRKVERAVAAGDGAGLYPLLDPTTQKAIDATYKSQRLMRTIIAAKYPPADAERELKRLDPAAADEVVGYFAKVAAQRQLFNRLRRRLGSVSGPITTKPDGAALLIARQDGIPFRLEATRGRWCFVELAAEWALEKDRADHAVRTVHDNAALYQKANP